MKRPLRIAMLTHSTNPRGGVVHALELSEALAALGHDVTLHAPDPRGEGFFRPTRCRTVSVPAVPTPSSFDMTAMVELRIADYVRHFESATAREFDLFHGHDGISANALATLAERRLIPGFVRTVHHIDDFADPVLMALQARSIARAGAWACVGAEWRETLAAEFGAAATLVGNGVDTRRFSPRCDASDPRLAERLALPPGPVFLSIGGVEERKNTVRILEAFGQVRAVLPDAQLVIAGGVSLLNHSAYRSAFEAELLRTGARGVHLIGAVPDAEMPALYRLADALVFASVKEGFGLCVLEAMTCGTPVVVSSIRPFTEYLAPGDAVWCDPTRPVLIAKAMRQSLQPGLRRQLRSRGQATASRHSWADVARRHLPIYEQFRELADA